MTPPPKSLEAEIILDPLKSYIKLYYWCCLTSNKPTSNLYTVLLVYNNIVMGVNPEELKNYAAINTIISPIHGIYVTLISLCLFTNSVFEFYAPRIILLTVYMSRL